MEVTPTRKPNRLTGFEYNTPHAYFITVCTKNRTHLLWQNVGAIIDRPENVRLSALGNIVERTILNIPIHYPTITVDQYVVMPNHIHLLLQIHCDTGGRSVSAPTISTVIWLMKAAATKEAGFPLWQKGFYDHVIRNETDYAEVWNYIAGNPLKWEDDELRRQTC
jgi:REP element-mobilizing transposase RayT